MSPLDRAHEACAVLRPLPRVVRDCTAFWNSSPGRARSERRARPSAGAAPAGREGRRPTSRVDRGSGPLRFDVEGCAVTAEAPAFAVSRPAGRRQCVHCGGILVGLRSHARYCSTSCRVVAYRRRKSEVA
jgi:hypothetical protein